MNTRATSASRQEWTKSCCRSSFTPYNSLKLSLCSVGSEKCPSLSPIQSRSPISKCLLQQTSTLVTHHGKAPEQERLRQKNKIWTFMIQPSNSNFSSLVPQNDQAATYLHRFYMSFKIFWIHPHSSGKSSEVSKSVNGMGHIRKELVSDVSVHAMFFLT